MNESRTPFTVLMSCYAQDVPEYLNLAIESIYDSTLIPSQVLLIVDGPVGKELEEVILKWDRCHDNFELKRLPDNLGLGGALRFGLLSCKYELVARMDSDDVCEKYRFENQLKAFGTDENLAICGTDILEFDNEGNESKRVVPRNADDIIKYSRIRNPLNHVTVMFKKSMILDVGSYEDVLYFEDYYLWLKCIQKGLPIKNIDHVGVFVRTGKSMIGRRLGLKYVKHELDFIIKSYRGRLITFGVMLKMITLRIPPRFFGTSLLQLIYKFMRD